jgi:hypothetical protein
MRRILWTALLALPFCAQPAQAQLFCCQGSGMCVSSNCPCPILCNKCCSLWGCGQQPPMGPWYLGFPSDGPTPWPATSFAPQMPLTGHVSFGLPPSIPVVSMQRPMPAQTPAFQPVGYFSGQTPSYWYGR